MLLPLAFMLWVQFTLSIKRGKREIAAGPSEYTSPDLSGPFVIESGDSGYCLQVEGTIVKATTCNAAEKAQQWSFHNRNLLRNQDTGSCLLAVGSGYTGVSVSSCGDFNAQKWDCNTKSSGRPGLKTQGANKCLRVNDDRTIDLQPCDHNARNQLIRIFDQPNQFICTRKTDVGTRTNDPNYYLLKHSIFYLGWNEKYVKVFLVYNKDLYDRFLRTYNSKDAALKAIQEHAVEAIAILDKAYRQIKVRMLLVGYEVWSDGDKIPVTNQYFVLKSKFREYSYFTLRKTHHFDTSVYVYGGSWDGGWAGAGMSDMCKAFNGNPNDEVFVMAMHHSTSAHSLAHLLSHEFGHQFNMGHPMEPDNPCPNYRLHGTRCTMGGNSWPKGFSERFLHSIRNYHYSCLDTKPFQNKIILCGNGVLDPMEECDCGTSQDCLTNDPCCDGSICKLKKGAQCSSETCCNNCKYDGSKSGCQGDMKVITAVSGSISSPSNGRSFHQHWRIEAPAGKRIKLSFVLHNFEFQEDCPFDYIEVRDGSSLRSKLINRFCRLPKDVFIKSTSNTVLVTHHADRTYHSSFTIYHNAVDKREDYGQFFIKHYGGLCVTYDDAKSYFKLTKSCNDFFTLDKDGSLKHVKSNKCVKPSGYGNGSPIVLTAACHSLDTLFTFTGQFSLFHGLTGKCIHPQTGYAHPPENNRIVLYSGCNQERLQFKPYTSGGFKREYFHIKHRSGKCATLDQNKKIFILTSSCKDTFTFTTGGRLLHQQSDDCVKPSAYGNGYDIIVTTDCDSEEAVFTFTAKGSIHHQLSKKCIHPKSGGYGDPPEGDRLVIYSGCDIDRLRFTQEKAANPDNYFMIQHRSGKCFHFDNASKKFVLQQKCKDVFTFTLTGSLLHLQSKECVKPKGHNNGNEVGLTNDCSADESILIFTEKHSIKHKVTGKCLHPRSGGFRNPPEGDPMVIYAGCDVDRLSFSQVKVGKPAY